MRTDYSAGRLRITLGFSEFLSELTKQELLELIEPLSCEDKVIDHVMDQVVLGYKESGYHGSVTVGGSVNPLSGLDKAKKRIAYGAGFVTRERLKMLEQKIIEKMNSWTKQMNQ